MNPEILKAIEVLSKKTCKGHYDTTYEDLVHDGMVLVMGLYKKKPGADDDWIFKALHNFYAGKRRKLRTKEFRDKYKRTPLKTIEEIIPDNFGKVPQEAEPEVSIEDSEIDQIARMVESGMSKEEILTTLNLSERELRKRLNE